MRRRRWTWIAAAAGLAALVAADRAGLLLVRRPDDMAAYHGRTARVARVIDGATLEIEVPDAAHDRALTVVRLWGVDCQKLREARELARELAGGEPVTLALEAHRTRGAFDRVLAHVELADGSSLNEALLAAGLARVDERWPHSLLERYAQLERAARRQGLGIWSESRPSVPQ